MPKLESTQQSFMTQNYYLNWQVVIQWQQMPSKTLNAQSISTIKLDESTAYNNNTQLHAIAFAEIVSYIEGFTDCQETVPVFILMELSKMHCSILEDQGVVQTSRLHSTRLKEKLEAEILDMVSYKRERDIVLAFDQHMEDVIAKACERNDDSEALQLAREAALIRRDIFNQHKTIIK